MKIESQVAIVTGVQRGLREVKWSGEFVQRVKMYPAKTTGYTNDEETQFFGQV